MTHLANPATLAKLAEWQRDLNAGAALYGHLVRFNHQPQGPLYRVKTLYGDGMVEIDGLPGKFAPHLFTIATNEQADD